MSGCFCHADHRPADTRACKSRRYPAWPGDPGDPGGRACRCRVCQACRADLRSGDPSRADRACRFRGILRTRRRGNRAPRPGRNCRRSQCGRRARRRRGGIPSCTSAEGKVEAGEADNSHRHRPNRLRHMPKGMEAEGKRQAASAAGSFGPCESPCKSRRSLEDRVSELKPAGLSRTNWTPRIPLRSG
jgi:hypothetical protein